MTETDARTLLTQAFASVSNDRQTREALLQFDRLLPAGIDKAYAMTLTGLLGAAALADYAHAHFEPEHRYQDLRLTLAEYNNTLPSERVVGLLFADADTAVQQQLLAILARGDIDHNDLIFVWASLAGQPTPAPSDWETIWHAILSNPHVRADGLLALPDLPLAGLETADVHWILAVYVAAFGRAPEFSGLHYWAERFVEVRDGDGLDRSDTIRLLARDMDWLGRQHHEHGSLLDDAALVNHLYTQVLGRTADLAGYQYWTDALASGAVERGDFVALFLNSALQNPGDGNLLRARIAVAAEASWADLTGTSLGPHDRVTVLDGVTDLASALLRIDTIRAAIHGGPDLPSHLPASTDPDPSTWLLALPEVATAAPSSPHDPAPSGFDGPVVPAAESTTVSWPDTTLGWD